jgi:hypothetical protein
MILCDRGSTMGLWSTMIFNSQTKDISFSDNCRLIFTWFHELTNNSNFHINSRLFPIQSRTCSVSLSMNLHKGLCFDFQCWFCRSVTSSLHGNLEERDLWRPS